MILPSNTLPLRRALATPGGSFLMAVRARRLHIGVHVAAACHVSFIYFLRAMRGVFTFVLTRESVGWLIAAAQNTEINRTV